MRLIALETATEACSAALWIDGELRWLLEPAAARRHGELILDQVDRLLAEAGLVPAQLDAVAVGRGPGAFTGVRLGLGVAQGLAFAIGCPVVPVSTLAALAQQGAERGALEVLAVLDARMGEVYWSLLRVGPEGLVEAAEEHLTPRRRWRRAGRGSRVLPWGTVSPHGRTCRDGSGWNPRRWMPPRFPVRARWRSSGPRPGCAARP
jgi:tRNA threonylcarbamoyladenosine biosynthesis protein TsaB